MGPRSGFCRVTALTPRVFGPGLKSMGLFTSSHVEAASTLAAIASSNEPLLFLAGDLRIIAASASFCRTFQIVPASVQGRQLSELGAGEWAMPKLMSLLKATASGSAEIAAYEIDLVRKGGEPRYLVVKARKLDDGDKDRVRLLLAVSDVTFARAESRQKDDLIRVKAILLQEVATSGRQQPPDHR
jgi:PAS domain-containing protein